MASAEAPPGNGGEQHGEMERMRLAREDLERQFEQFRLFIEHHRVSVAPISNAAELSRRMADGYGRLAIQTMYLLNGGALLVFPGFAKLADKNFHHHLGVAVAGMSAFVIGLALDAVTTMLAYLGMDADAHGLHMRAQVAGLELQSAHYPISNTSENATNRLALTKQSDARAKRVSVLIGWAIAAAIASLVAFIAGAACAAMVLAG